jgi:hypothetical protein
MLAVTEVPFEVIGALPQDVLADLTRVAAELAKHPWGGLSVDLLLVGDARDLLPKYMPPARFAEWRAGYEGGRIAITSAISFRTAGGRRAAWVPPIADREMGPFSGTRSAGPRAPLGGTLRHRDAETQRAPWRGAKAPSTARCQRRSPAPCSPRSV